jgi:hypothetical protein
MLKRGTSDQDANHPTPGEELQELKDENERLRRSLTLLHAHSLSLQDRLDALLARTDTMSGACEALAARMREAPRADVYPRSSAGQIDEKVYNYLV